MNFDLKSLAKLAEQAIIMTGTGQPFLDERYQEHLAKFNYHQYYYHFFYLLARELRPRSVVELGGWQGTAAAHFAAGSPGSIVVTIDHHTDPGDDYHKAKMEEACRKYINLKYIQGWTWDVVEQVKALAEPIDILFIDSWHDYDHAMRDWLAYSPLLAISALVIVDDMLEDDFDTISGMRRFWNELPGKKNDRVIETSIHPGFPMGLLKFNGFSRNRSAGRTKPAAIKQLA